MSWTSYTEDVWVAERPGRTGAHSYGIGGLCCAAEEHSGEGGSVDGPDEVFLESFAIDAVRVGVRCVNRFYTFAARWHQRK